MNPLPVATFDLAPWPPATAEAWAQHTSRADRLAVRAGTGRHFDAVVAEARALLDTGDEDSVASRLTERRFTRAVVTAWAEDRALARRTMTPALIQRLRGPGSTVSRLATVTLAHLLLTHFDLLDSWHGSLFDEMTSTIAAAVGLQPARRTDLVETLRQDGDYYLHPQGPQRLARHLLATGTSLSRWFAEHHLGEGTRFQRLTADAVLLVQIQAADAEAPHHPWTADLSRSEVTRMTNEADPLSRRMLGHDILEALTAKTTLRPSDAWIAAIVAIGGDPRLRGTPPWETWWSRVTPSALATALRWIAGVDLRAFLDGIDQYARATHNEPMVRMLERRATLLSGLYEQGLVRDVRLILGDDIRTAIRKSTPISVIDAPRLIDPGKGDTAVIYVDCGTFALVEGSHNFQLHVYTGPAPSALSDPLIRAFTGDELRYDIPNSHRGGYESFRHDPFGAWVRAVLDYLRSAGIRIDERSLVTRDDYTKLQVRRGRRRHR